MSVAVGATARQDAQDHQLSLLAVAPEAHAPVPDAQTMLVDAGAHADIEAGIVGSQPLERGHDALADWGIEAPADHAWPPARRPAARECRSRDPELALDLLVASQ